MGPFSTRGKNISLKGRSERRGRGGGAQAAAKVLGRGQGDCWTLEAFVFAFSNTLFSSSRDEFPKEDDNPASLRPKKRGFNVRVKHSKDRPMVFPNRGRPESSVSPHKKKNKEQEKREGERGGSTKRRQQKGKRKKRRRKGGAGKERETKKRGEQERKREKTSRREKRREKTRREEEMEEKRREENKRGRKIRRRGRKEVEKRDDEREEGNKNPKRMEEKSEEARREEEGGGERGEKTWRRKDVENPRGFLERGESILSL